MTLIEKLGTPTGEVLPCDNCAKTAPLVFAGWADEFCQTCWDNLMKRVRRAQHRNERELARALARAAK